MWTPFDSLHKDMLLSSVEQQCFAHPYSFMTNPSGRGLWHHRHVFSGHLLLLGTHFYFIKATFNPLDYFDRESFNEENRV